MVNKGIAVEAGVLEEEVGKRNSCGNGDNLREKAEQRLGRQVSGVKMTLRIESEGSKQD